MNASEKSLLRAWVVMMTLSIALAVAADPMRPHSYALMWTAFICIIAYWKARIVLSSYLGLQTVPGARAGFSFAIAFILAMALGSFALELAITTVR